MSRRVRLPILMIALAAARCSGDSHGGTPDGGNGPIPRPDSGAPTNCDNNPAGCEAGQLRGPAPSCTCLPGCMPGYVFDGTRCSRPDSGSAAGPDAAGAQDGGTAADAAPPIDAGSPPSDSGTPASDSGTPPSDSGTPPSDSGSPPGDSGTTQADAAPVTDGGSPPADAAAMDAAPTSDIGPAPADAAANDAAPSSDATVPSDSGTQDAGVLAGEGQSCTASPNDCQAGMVCFVAQGQTTGVCLRTCDTTHNLAGTYANAACTGIGQDCVDRFGLGPTNGRCLNVLAEYGEFRPNMPPLAACDPAFANDFMVTSALVTGGGACTPLCTVTRSQTTPVNLTCTGTYTNCDASEGTVSDGAGNVFGFCTIPVARGQVCGFERGRSCASGDICAANLCHQHFGITCTATTTCQNSAEQCISVAVGATSIAYCHQPCNPLQPQSCGVGLACGLDSDGRSSTIFGSCRALTGQVAQGGSCSDVFSSGARISDCNQGEQCQPVAPATDLTNAQCDTLCNPATPACPVNTTCHPFAPPNNGLGLCQ